jgi:hypothetical protein
MRRDRSGGGPDPGTRVRQRRLDLIAEPLGDLIGLIHGRDDRPLLIGAPLQRPASLCQTPPPALSTFQPAQIVEADLPQRPLWITTRCLRDPHRAGWQVGAGRFSAQPLARRTPVPLINGLRRPVYPASPRGEQNQLTVTQA